MNTNSELTEIKRIVQQNREILHQHGDLLIQLSKDQSYLRGALDQITERLGSLDARVNSLENRVSTVENRINEVESRLSEDIREVESRLSKDIRENFKWI